MDTPATTPAPIDPVDDLSRLEKVDWVAASILRFRIGFHPDPTMEALLARRMDLKSRNFLGPYPLRLACTFGMVLIFTTFAWILLWAFFSVIGFTLFVRELSALMVTLLMVLFGIAFSHPMKIYDEQAVEKAGAEMIRLLRLEIAEIEANRPSGPQPG